MKDQVDDTRHQGHQITKTDRFPVKKNKKNLNNPYTMLTLHPELFRCGLLSAFLYFTLF